MNSIRGKVILLGDDVDTDQILPGYAMSEPYETLGKFALAGLSDPVFRERHEPGTIIVAGRNFGCGSSREQAPIALQQAGVALIIASSFARIFRRNCINIGLPVLAADARGVLQNGDSIEVDLENSVIKAPCGEIRGNPLSESVRETLRQGGLIARVRAGLGGESMQEKTKKIIREDIEAVRAYADCFGVTMPDLDEEGNVVGLPGPYPRSVCGVVRGGQRIYELAKLADERGYPVQNPILGRNSASETLRESEQMYGYAEKLGETLFHFVHAEATRHIDPLAGRELIEQSRGKGGITPQGERDFILQGGGAKHPLRINATGDTPHLSIINALIAGFDGTDIGPVIHVHFGGRGIHDYKTKVINGYKAIQICAENNIFVQLDSHKHLNNIGGTDGMALAMCLLAEGLGVHAGLNWQLSAIQMNIAGINLYADLAVMRAFKEMILSKSIVVVPETFQSPPGDLIAEAAHFARMAIGARLGGVQFYRPKAAESVGIPTGDSMGHAIWGTQDVFANLYNPGIESAQIDARKEEIKQEALAVLEATLGVRGLTPSDVNEEFWRRFSDEELIDRIVEAGKSGKLDCPRAGGWDLKRHVRTNRDRDGVRRYVRGYTPLGVDAERMPTSSEDVVVQEDIKPTRPEKIVLATVGADAHVTGINVVREAFVAGGYEVIYLRGMNLPETVAEVAAEVQADAVGVSNLLGLGITLFPRVGARLSELGLREQIVVVAGGRVAEKEEEHRLYEEKMKEEGCTFLGVDAFFGPGTDTEQCVVTVGQMIEEKKKGRAK